MTNKERQVRLDKKKWRLSQVCGKDMSGLMIYCYSCVFRESNNNSCRQSQADRENLGSCAVAYNKMTREK